VALLFDCEQRNSFENDCFEVDIDNAQFGFTDLKERTECVPLTEFDTLEPIFCVDRAPIKIR